MKKVLACLGLLLLFNMVGCVDHPSLPDMIATQPEDSIYEKTMKQDLFCLMLAYPEHIIGIEKEADNRVHIVMKSGQRILYDDKKTKNIEEKLAYTDLQDMMEQAYPLEDISSLMPKNVDPGRIRSYPLLKEVYGATQGQVKGKLVPVAIGNKMYPFNHNNRAAESLKKAMSEINNVAKGQPKLYGFIGPAGGTFNYRVIAGTNRLSPHSFGTAVDFARHKYDYWQWATREEGQKRLDTYPREIVRIMEKNYFIWGGKWGHFDILHFEYRPELILKAKYFPGKVESSESWDEGLPAVEASIQKYVRMVNDAFKE